MPDGNSPDKEDSDSLRLREANTQLSKKKDSIPALRTKAIALIKLDRDDDALKLFDDTPALRDAAVVSGDRDRQLECAYAYALYKDGRFEDVWRAFGGGAAGATAGATAGAGAEGGGGTKAMTGTGSRGLRHVLAQTAYRSEDYEAAKALYRDLERGEAVIGNERHDLSVNEKAVDAQLGWTVERVGVHAGMGYAVDGKIDGFEEAFNVGCRCVALGDLDGAEVMLRKASDLCKAGDLTEEEYREEMCYILSQQIYLVLLRQDKDRAMQMSSSLDVSLLKDPISKRITQNNLTLHAKSGTNPYLLQRTISNQGSLPPDARFSGFQKRLIQRNDLALSLSTRKYNGLRKGNFTDSDPSPLAEPSKSVFRAAAECHCHDNRAVKKQLLKNLRKRPDDIGVLLLLLHLHVRSKKRKAALSQLNEFLKNMRSFSPATSRQVTPYLPGLISIWLALVSPRTRKRAGSKPGGCTFGEGGVLTKAGTLLDQTFDATALPNPLTRIAGAALLTSAASKDLNKAQKVLSTLARASQNRNTTNNSDADDSDDSDDADDRAIDPVANAGIVAAQAQLAALSNNTSSESTPENELATKATLIPVPKIIKSLDAAALEREGGRFQPVSQPSSRTPQRNRQDTQRKKSTDAKQNSTTPNPTSTSTPKRSKSKSEASKEKSKRTPRKRHLIASKQADPDTTSTSGPPDPERWLPIRDRSSYKPPRSKSGKGGGGGGAGGGKAKGKGGGKASGAGKGRDAGGVTQGGL